MRPEPPQHVVDREPLPPVPQLPPGSARDGAGMPSSTSTMDVVAAAGADVTPAGMPSSTSTMDVAVPLASDVVAVAGGAVTSPAALGQGPTTGNRSTMLVGGGLPADEAWRSGGWTQVLAAFSADPEGASPDLAAAAQDIMDHVARALEDSDDGADRGCAALPQLWLWLWVALCLADLFPYNLHF